MTLLTIFNAVIPMPILLHRYGGGSNPNSAIAVCASIAIVGIFLMLLSFAYFTAKSYFKHKKNPKYYSFTFFEILEGASDSFVFWLGALFVLAMLIIAIVALIYGFLMANL